MKKNLGKRDRIIRLLIALALFALSYWANNWILFFVALFVLYEALTSWCVIYHIARKSSCPIDKDKRK